MLLEIFIILIIAATLIGIGVHFIPVGGAPAALSTSAGIPTGAPMITMGMGITGILSAASLIGQENYIIILAGAIASMMMMAITMFFSNIVHVYGVGVPIASSNFQKDPITGFEQENYVSPGTKGHGIPTISFISGLIGSFMGGLGGSLSFNNLYTIFSTNMQYQTTISGTLAATLSLLLFFILAVMASYNIGGTIQGFYDKKFKEKIIPGFISCFLISIIISIVYMLIIWGLNYV